MCVKYGGNGIYRVLSCLQVKYFVLYGSLRKKHVQQDGLENTVEQFII